MPKIYVEINQQVNFNIIIRNDPVSSIFYRQHVDLMRRQPESYKAKIVDATKYTINYFIDLIKQAQSQGAIDWSHYDIKFGPEYYAENQLQFNNMHKDLEVVAGIHKYGDLSSEARSLIDEMHCCLHTLETDSAPLDYNFTGRDWILFNYYADLEKTLMPEPVKFTREIQPGQVILDYCYVGKEPLVCALHDDNSILLQTCKMIDRISASWKLYTGKYTCQAWLPQMPDNIDQTLTNWYYQHEDDMKTLGYSLEKIIDHTGFYVVGEIDDHSVFSYLNNTPNITVTDYKLVD